MPNAPAAFAAHATATHDANGGTFKIDEAAGIAGGQDGDRQPADRLLGPFGAGDQADKIEAVAGQADDPRLELPELQECRARGFLEPGRRTLPGLQTVDDPEFLAE